MRFIGRVADEATDTSARVILVKVAAVDGSRSPRMSERLGVRYGVFSVGAVVLMGSKRVKGSGCSACGGALLRGSS